MKTSRRVNINLFCVILLLHVEDAYPERTNVEDVEGHGLNASVSGGDITFPRLCGLGNSGWKQGNDCCVCGKSYGRKRSFDQLLPTCRVEGSDNSRVCCPVWTVDCKESDPWYQAQITDGKGYSLGSLSLAYQERWTIGGECTMSEEQCTSEVSDCTEIADQNGVLLEQMMALKQDAGKTDLDIVQQNEFLKYVAPSRFPEDEGMGQCGWSCGEVRVPADFNGLSLPPYTCARAVRARRCTKDAACCHDRDNCKRDDPWYIQQTAAIKQVIHGERKVRTDASNEYAQKEQALVQGQEQLKQCVQQCQFQVFDTCVEEFKQVDQKDGLRSVSVHEVEAKANWQRAIQIWQRNEQHKKREREQVNAAYDAYKSGRNHGGHHRSQSDEGCCECRRADGEARGKATCGPKQNCASLNSAKWNCIDIRCAGRQVLSCSKLPK